jgi:hypothetical protein
MAVAVAVGLVWHHARALFFQLSTPPLKSSVVHVV